VSDEVERRHLAQANRHIVEAARRIARQELLIAKLEHNGRDTTAAAELLRQFEEIQQLMVRHRDMILQGLDRSSGNSN
jgi:hypothetical protein